jgi:F-type H+-transporting ATPase subunit alpha
MKQVAGSLRLAMAQYRAMAAFAQFGSDLDKATQDQLTRGERMVAILKQGQYQPLPVEKQVMIIWAANAGFLDKIPTDRVSDYEKGAYEFVEQKYPKVFETLKTKKAIDDELKPVLEKAFTEYTANFA